MNNSNQNPQKQGGSQGGEDSIKEFQEKQEQLLGKLVGVLEDKLNLLENEMGNSEEIDKALKEAGFSDGLQSLRDTMKGLVKQTKGESGEEKAKEDERPLNFPPFQKS